MKKYAVAVLTIKEAGAMTKKGHKDIAEWLRARAEELENHGGEMARVFRARYFATESRKAPQR